MSGDNRTVLEKRGAVPMNHKLKDVRQPATVEEAREARKYVNLVAVDVTTEDGNGGMRRLDVRNEEDRRLLSARANLYLLNNTGEMRGSSFITVGAENVPFPVKEHAFIPPYVMEILKSHHEVDIDAQLTTGLWLDVPVFTSYLIPFILKTHMPVVWSAVGEVRTYNVMIKVVLAKENTATAVKVATERLSEYSDSDLDALVAFAENALDSNGESVRDDLMKLSGDGRARDSYAVKSAMERVSKVKPHVSSWFPQDCDVAEVILDTLEDLLSAARFAFVEDLRALNLDEKTSVVSVQESKSKFLVALYRYIASCLHVYEVSIMRLLGTDAIPREWRQWFITRPEAPDPAIVTKELKDHLVDSRRRMRDSRDAFMGVKPRPRSEKVMGSDAPFPSVMEIVEHLKYVSFDSKSRRVTMESGTDGGEVRTEDNLTRLVDHIARGSSAVPLLEGVEKMSLEETEDKCILCSNKKDHLFYPCMHACVCWYCGSTYDKKTCPVCDKPYSQIVRVFK
jgi:hypothetical protein